MELTSAIRQFGAGRVAVGAALMAKPDSAYGWVGADADGRGAQVLAKALGIRDLVIGAGTAAKAGDPKAVRPWLLAGIASDFVDFAATLGGPDAPARKAILGVAGSSTAAGLYYLLRA
jgi:hypothetical protein